MSVAKRHLAKSCMTYLLEAYRGLRNHKSGCSSCSCTKIKRKVMEISNNCRLVMSTRPEKRSYQSKWKKL